MRVIHRVWMIFLLVALPGMADAFDAIQITNNDVYDVYPDVSGSNVVWMQCEGATDPGCSGGAFRIYHWDGSTISEIPTSGTEAGFPAISGSNVVYGGFDGSTGQIYLWDGTTTTQITNDGDYDHRPAISGSNVVWLSCDGDAHWSCSNGDWEIYYWDGSFPIVPVRVTDNDTDDEFVDVSGSMVVWDARDGSIDDDYEIYRWDGATTTQITDNSTDERYPRISGSNVVWTRCEFDSLGYCSGDLPIYLWDGSTTSLVTDDDSSGVFPAISGSNVVWTGCGKDPCLSYEIALRSGMTIRQITNNTVRDVHSRISGLTVVWEGCDDAQGPGCQFGDSEIYITTLSEPVPGLPAAAILLTAGLFSLAGWLRFRA
jgi:hypothetical protein